MTPCKNFIHQPFKYEAQNETRLTFSLILSDGAFHGECLVCAVSKTLQASHRMSGNCRPRLIIDKIKSKFDVSNFSLI